MDFKVRLERVKTSLSGPYFFLFLLIFVSYMTFDVLVNKLYIRGVVFNGNYLFSYTFVLFSAIVTFLTAVSVNLIIYKIFELESFREESKKLEIKKANAQATGVTFLGMFGGLLAGACPGCVAGLFPAVAGLIGVSISLANLPFYGIELQLLSCIFLLIGIFLLTRDNVCKI